MKEVGKVHLVAHLALLALLAPAAAAAAVFTVNTNSDRATGAAENCVPGNVNSCTLRDAIAAAKGGDQIVFNLPAGSTMIALANKELVLKDTTGVVTIDGSNTTGAGQVQIDGRHSSRVLFNSEWTTTRILNLTIRNGACNCAGAGIYNDGVLELADVHLVYNDSKNYGGGAIYNSDRGLRTSVTIRDSLIEHNQAGSGAGIFNANNKNLNYVTLGMENVVVRGNSTTKHGGAITNNGKMTFVGGAILENSLSVAIFETGQGAGLATYGDASLESITFANNLRSGGIVNGGALFSSGRTLVVNSTITANSATRGAGVYLGGGSISFVNTTIASNTGGDQQALYKYSSGLVVSAANSIFDGGCGNGGVSTDAGGNLDTGTSCALGAGFSKSNAILALGPLQDNGGRAHTLMPGPGSDAIDFVDCSSAPPRDQRGAARPDPASVGKATRCDAGAVEAGSVPNDLIFVDGFEVVPGY